MASIAACRVYSANADGRPEYRFKPPTRPPSRKISMPIWETHPASAAAAANRGHRVSVRMSSTTTDGVLRVAATFRWDADITLGELGLFGGDASSAPDTGYLIAYRTHPPVTVPAGQRLTRTLELSFGGGVAAIDTGIWWWSAPTGFDHWVAATPGTSIDGVGDRLGADLTAAGFNTIGQLAAAEPVDLVKTMHSSVAVTLPTKARLLLIAIARSIPVPEPLATMSVTAAATASTTELAAQLAVPATVIDAARALCGVLEMCLDEVTLHSVSIGDIVNPRPTLP